MRPAGKLRLTANTHSVPSLAARRVSAGHPPLAAARIGDQAAKLIVGHVMNVDSAPPRHFG
jgi:hypothetical protein